MGNVAPILTFAWTTSGAYPSAKVAVDCGRR